MDEILQTSEHNFLNGKGVYQCVLFLYILFLVLPIFEVPVPKSVVPNVGLSYVLCVLFLRSYLYVTLQMGWHPLLF